MKNQDSFELSQSNGTGVKYNSSLQEDSIKGSSAKQYRQPSFQNNSDKINIQELQDSNEKIQPKGILKYNYQKDYQPSRQTGLRDNFKTFQENPIQNKELYSAKPINMSNQNIDKNSMLEMTDKLSQKNFYQKRIEELRQKSLDQDPNNSNVKFQNKYLQNYNPMEKEKRENELYSKYMKQNESNQQYQYPQYQKKQAKIQQQNNDDDGGAALEKRIDQLEKELNRNFLDKQDQFSQKKASPLKYHQQQSSAKVEFDQPQKYNQMFMNQNSEQADLDDKIAKLKRELQQEEDSNYQFRQKYEDTRVNLEKKNNYQIKQQQDEELRIQKENLYLQNNYLKGQMNQTRISPSPQKSAGLNQYIKSPNKEQENKQLMAMQSQIHQMTQEIQSLKNKNGALKNQVSQFKKKERKTGKQDKQFKQIKNTLMDIDEFHNEQIKIEKEIELLKTIDRIKIKIEKSIQKKMARLEQAKQVTEQNITSNQSRLGQQVNNSQYSQKSKKTSTRQKQCSSLLQKGIPTKYYQQNKRF